MVVVQNFVVTPVRVLVLYGAYRWRHAKRAREEREAVERREAANISVRSEQSYPGAGAGGGLHGVVVTDGNAPDLELAGGLLLD